MRTSPYACFATCLLGWQVLAVAEMSSRFTLTREGQPAAFIFAPGENQWAGERLVDRTRQWTGVRLPFRASGILPETELNLIAVGTPQTNPVVRVVLGSEPRLALLGEEGYILKIGTWKDRPVLVVGGATLPGVQNAVSELVSWKLRLDRRSAHVPGDLDEIDTPALKYRVLWNWTLGTHWPTRLAEVYEPDPQNANESPGYAQGAVGFLEHHRRAIDFFSDHKLNGLILWHFLNDAHGGVDAGREIIRYGRRRNVRILPGIGTVVYNGFYSSGKSPYCMTQFLKDHPEVRRAIKADGELAALPCSQDPVYQKWLAEGTRWFFGTFPDVGGANVEHGDFHACHCELCKAEKAKPGNDPNCFWDMKTTQSPIFEISRELRPDAWMIFATYSGFTEEALSRNLEEAALPPKFLDQYPPNAVCQWTLTKMITPETWPEGVGPPTGAIREHIGYIHQGGLRSCCPGHPVDKERWWAGPSAIGDEISEVIQFLCGRIEATGMAGLVMYGEIGAVVPAAELRYIAMEYFTWHPERTMDDFVRDRLSVCYGSEERARLFLKLLRNVTKDPVHIDRDRLKAGSLAADQTLDVRQKRRWRNLADELSRRQKLLEEQQTE